jgi:hypothetical protein
MSATNTVTDPGTLAETEPVDSETVGGGTAPIGRSTWKGAFGRPDPAGRAVSGLPKPARQARPAAALTVVLEDGATGPADGSTAAGSGGTVATTEGPGTAGDGAAATAAAPVTPRRGGEGLEPAGGAAADTRRARGRTAAPVRPVLADLIWKPTRQVHWVKSSASLPVTLIDHLKALDLPLLAATRRRVAGNGIIVAALERFLADPDAALSVGEGWEPEGPCQILQFQLPEALYEQLLTAAARVRAGDSRRGIRHLVGPALAAHLDAIEAALPRGPPGWPAASTGAARAGAWATA